MTVNGVRCPACGGAVTTWKLAPAGEPRDSRRFAVARCIACGTGVTLGDPPAPDAYESGTYAEHRPRAHRSIRLVQRALAREPVRMLRRAGVGPGSRVLDAGAGSGRLVTAMRASGYDAIGIEPSARSRQRAVARGAPVMDSTIETFQDTGFDAVLLWHVLEHVETPSVALECVRTWLRPGGVVLIGVPNIASWQARIAGSSWLHLDVPRHRTHFTPAGLSFLLHDVGFSPNEVSHLVWEHNPGAMWMAWLSAVGGTPGFPFHLLKRNVDVTVRDVLLTAAGLAVAPAAVVLELVAAAAKSGGTVVATARR